MLSLYHKHGIEKYFGEHLTCFEKIAVRDISGLVQLLSPKEVLDEIKGIKENVH